MANKKYDASEKLVIIGEIESGEIGVKAAAKKYGISKTTLVKWRRRYKGYVYEGLEKQNHNRSYSAGLKLQAVKDYIEGGLSQYQIIDKYKIASRTQLSNWIKEYNRHSSLKAYSGGAKAMRRGVRRLSGNGSILCNTVLLISMTTVRQRTIFRSPTSKSTNG